MNTTGYFIELLVAGFSNLAWWFLLTLCIWDVWIPVGLANSLLQYPSFVIISFPVVYIAGIVSDRMADLFFLNYTSISKIEREFFDSHKDYEKCRSVIYLKSQSLSELYEYSRMRIRICRNWVFNSPLIWVFGTIFVIRDNYFKLTNNDKFIIFLFTAFLFLGSTIMTYKSLKILIRKECSFIKIQADLIEQNQSWVVAGDRQHAPGGRFSAQPNGCVKVQVREFSQVTLPPSTPVGVGWCGQNASASKSGSRATGCTSPNKAVLAR